jgi:hypothetical protein
MVSKRVHRIFTIMLVCFSLSTATAVASSIWGEFEGYSKARVLVNDVETQFSSADVPGFIVKGSTVLPLRTLADSLQALVKWDNSNKTAYIYKPNVHMFVVKDISKDYTMKSPFGEVKQGVKISFFVFPQVDNLNASISSFKISIVSPSGTNAVEPYEESIDEQKKSFWRPIKFNNISFDEYGVYTVKFSMKLSDGTDYVVVSEKQILSE